MTEDMHAYSTTCAFHLSTLRHTGWGGTAGKVGTRQTVEKHQQPLKMHTILHVTRLTRFQVMRAVCLPVFGERGERQRRHFYACNHPNQQAGPLRLRSRWTVSGSVAGLAFLGTSVPIEHKHACLWVYRSGALELWSSGAPERSGSGVILGSHQEKGALCQRQKGPEDET